MKVRSNPRDGKGICSDCSNLWVMETEFHGSDKIFCAWNRHLIPIRKPITACTKHETINDGTYSGFDAWHVNVQPDGAIEFKKGYGLRFIRGHYETYDDDSDKWVPMNIEKEKA